MDSVTSPSALTGRHDCRWTFLHGFLNRYESVACATDILKTYAEGINAHCGLTVGRPIGWTSYPRCRSSPYSDDNSPTWRINVGVGCRILPDPGEAVNPRQSFG